MSCRTLPFELAVRLVGEVAVFVWPRMKLPPVVAYAVPPRATKSARSEMTSEGEGRVKRRDMTCLLCEMPRGPEHKHRLEGASRSEPQGPGGSSAGAEANPQGALSERSSAAVLGRRP